MRIPKQVSKKILICGGHPNIIPVEMREIEHFTADEFPTVKPGVEHIVIVAKWFAHTKQDYIRKHYPSSLIHVVHGGQTRLRQALEVAIAMAQP